VITVSKRGDPDKEIEIFNDSLSLLDIINLRSLLSPIHAEETDKDSIMGLEKTLTVVVSKTVPQILVA
jgi:hypothetical protein